MSACITTPITWNGSVVAASSLMPPARGSTLTPVQVAVEGVVFLPPGERRARVASLAAAARIVPFMTLAQVNTLLGRPQGLTLVGDAMAYVTASAIHTIGFGWAAGTIDGARRTWLRMLAFATAHECYGWPRGVLLLGLHSQQVPISGRLGCPSRLQAPPP